MKTNINIITPAIGYESTIKIVSQKLNKEISKRLKEGRLTVTGMTVAIKLAFGGEVPVNTEYFAHFAGAHLFKVYVDGIYFEISIQIL